MAYWDPTTGRMVQDPGAAQGTAQLLPDYGAPGTAATIPNPAPTGDQPAPSMWPDTTEYGPNFPAGNVDFGYYTGADSPFRWGSMFPTPDTTGVIGTAQPAGGTSPGGTTAPGGRAAPGSSTGGGVEGGGRPTGNIVTSGMDAKTQMALSLLPMLQRWLQGGMGGTGGPFSPVGVPDFLNSFIQAATLARNRQGVAQANEAAATGGAGSRDLAYRQSLLDENLMNTVGGAGAQTAGMQFNANLQAQRLQAEQQIAEFRNMVSFLQAIGSFVK